LLLFRAIAKKSPDRTHSPPWNSDLLNIMIMTLADFFQVTDRTVRRWQQDGADTQSARGLLRYLRELERPAPGVDERLADPDVELALEDILDGVPPPAAAKTTPKSDLVALRVRKLQAQIQILDLRIGEENGTLLPVDAVYAASVRWATERCGELDALVGDLPGQLAGLPEADVKRILTNRVDHLKRTAREAFARLDAEAYGSTRAPRATRR